MNVDQIKSRIISLFCLLVIALLIVFFIISCSLSFSNISTHGTATDLLDEDLRSNPNIAPRLDIPIRPGGI